MNISLTKYILKIICAGITLILPLSAMEETLTPIMDGRVPQTVEELWNGFDPRKEPLDVEILKKWEEDGVVLRVLRYRIGIFKGQKAMMAAVYGYPKGGSDLPALVQIHGGGQFADHRAVLSNAKRGYATISIAWAGRISAPCYSVNAEGVQLFWDGKVDDPNYKLTTDWGALDAYHAPTRHSKNNFQNVAPADWTLDDVQSPRNSPWFLCTLAARRALTFLEEQPEVDAARLGIYGHSMGGKLTVLTTGVDTRVKAAAPSCGGMSDRYNTNRHYKAAIADPAYLERITCPIVFLSPANDFHGRIDDLQRSLGEIQSRDWRITCSPHHDHQDTPEYEVVGPLWFDQHLKADFQFPATPDLSLDLNTRSGTPAVTITPDPSKPLLAVDVYYTRQGQPEGERDNSENAKARFWHHANANRKGDTWTAVLPLHGTDKPLWVYANLAYALENSVEGAGYYYAIYQAEQFTLSSRMLVATAEQLQAAGVQSSLPQSLVIETFEKDWQKEWFTYDLKRWPRRTHKLHDPIWYAPAGARLSIDVRSESPNTLVIGLDEYGVEIRLQGGAAWQEIVLTPADFKNAAAVPLSSWKGVRQLRLGYRDNLRVRVGGKDTRLTLGGGWQGADPVFRNLRWVE